MSRILTFERELTKGINMFSWNGLDRLLRYQGSINRQLFQAMRELERMQERRKKAKWRPNMTRTAAALISSAIAVTRGYALAR